METGPRFDSKGRCYLNCLKRDGKKTRVVLTKTNWESHLRANPGRAWYRFNFDSIKRALRAPDERRESTLDDACMMHYARVDRVWVNETATIAKRGWFWCVVTHDEKIVKTIYFTPKIKRGKKI